MNKRFRETLPQQWIKYILIAILAIALWMSAFGLYHAPTPMEKLQVFYVGTVKDYSFQTDVTKALGIKKCNLYSSSPVDSVFNNKYTTVGLNGCDVVIVPKSVADATDCASVFLETNREGEKYTQGEGENAKDYGIYLTDAQLTKLSKYFEFGTERYIVFISAASVNSGIATDNAHKLVDWLVEE